MVPADRISLYDAVPCPSGEGRCVRRSASAEGFRVTHSFVKGFVDVEKAERDRRQLDRRKAIAIRFGHRVAEKVEGVVSKHMPPLLLISPKSLSS